MSGSRPRFILIDDNVEARFLYVRTLLRHYPDASVEECDESAKAVASVGALPTPPDRTVVVVHRTRDVGGRELVTTLRAAHPTVPIIWAEEENAMEPVQHGDATRTLDYRAWLLIGETVREFV